ncbi:flavone O-methyltransferase 1-like [Musa acuminata AAA Group]|uniref:flavone O-methyltransferase 1-like n=1 Tax=Musa acuminata AAA Group TaxID=214697 RepID=UPI0031D4788B
MASTKNIQQLTLSEEAGACALRLASSCALPFTLKGAIELRLLDIIVEAGPGAMLSPVEIVARLPTENPQAATMVDRMLRLLAANTVVSCTVQTGADGRPTRKYGAAPICKYLTKNEDGVSMAALALLLQDKIFVDTWHHLKDSVLEGGIPMKTAHGMFLFDYTSSDPKFSTVFNEGMGATPASSSRIYSVSTVASTTWRGSSMSVAMTVQPSK